MYLYIFMMAPIDDNATGTTSRAMETHKYDFLIMSRH